MENIDDLMRQKFDSDDPGARFEFREEYWEQAQALLEQDEARRRRRLWLFIGLVLAIALLAWLLMVQRGAGSLSQKGEGEMGLSGGNAFRQEVSSSVRPDPEKPPQSIGVESSSTNKTGDALGEGVRRSTITESSALKAKSLPGRLDKPDNQDVTIPQRSEKSAAALHSKGQLGIKTAAQNDLVKNEAKNASEVENAFDNSSQTDEKSPITSSPITTQPIAPQPAIIPIFNIPTPLTLFELPKHTVVPRKLLPVSKEPIAEKIKPVQEQRFSFGLSLAGAAYQQSDTAGRWAGWAMGVFGKYRLNKNWSFMLGAQGRFVPGQGTATDSMNPYFVEQLRYSFGYKRESWTRETRGLYYLEIPLSARWHKGAWGLEGGGTAGTLFMVQDRTEYTVESSLEGAKTEIKKFAKGSTKDYNQTYFSAFAGAEYRLNERLFVMARGQYRFTPVFKTLGEGVQNKGLGNVELGLRVRLF